MKLVIRLLLLAVIGCVVYCVVENTAPRMVRGQAPPARMEVGEDRLVSAGTSALPLVEPHFAVNPKDPKNLLAAAMVIAKPDMSSRDCATFSSLDGGRTWKRTDMGLRNAADVWLAFLPDGTAVLGLLGEANGADQLLLYRSSDGGQTWSNKPTLLGRGHDHPTLVVDSLGKQFAGSLYAIAGRGAKNKEGKSRDAVFVARSADGGVSFPNPAHVIASNLSYESHNPAILSDGTLLVPFADHRRVGDRRRLERQRDWLVTSTDGGQTFSEPLFISETCSATGGWSSLAVNSAEGAWRNRIYHLCASHQFAGIQMRFSADRGEQWSDPLRVDRPGRIEPYTRTPAIAVNQNGIVGIAWYDGRNDPSAGKGIFRCQEIYFTASLDGGESFLPEVKISTARSCPANSPDVQTTLRFPAGGEYMGMTTTPDGAFHLLWADNRTGVYQLRMATVKLNAKPENR